MNIQFKYNRDLERLEKYLNYKVGSSAPSPAYLFPDSLASAGIALAILATPIILWSLVKLKKYGWLTAFAVITILPVLTIDYLISGQGIKNVLYLIPLLFVAVYYFFLKQKIQDWKEPIFINKPGSDYMNG